jgi:signal peptidase I
MIVFRYPLNLKETCIKRVIGAPDDRVRLRAKQVFVNGEAPAEPYEVTIPGAGAA